MTLKNRFGSSLTDAGSTAVFLFPTDRNTARPHAGKPAGPQAGTQEVPHYSITAPLAISVATKDASAKL